ncbi:hypothetical protein [Demequina sp.]|uniref:hypothetical protein n=1 Tax=Demequina sp. TaxID=2050685 RepID=UPI0025E44565|nr:hypothetical protein [Demequina sp.]
MKLRNLTISAAVAALVLAIAAPASATQPTGPQPGNDGVHKVWVCVYSGTPDVDEVLKPGKNPIAVDASATAGEWFNDGQGRSYVVADVTDENTAQGERYTGTEACPTPSVPDETPVDQPGERPEDSSWMGEWTEQAWECGDEAVTLTREFGSTTWSLVDDEWLPSAQSGVEYTTRDFTAEEAASCEEGSTPPEETQEPDIDASVVTEQCTAKAPYLMYDIVVNDPDGKLGGKDTATITFVNPDGDNWSTTVAIGAGTVLWPGATVDGDGKATAWPGWEYDSTLGSWVDVGNDNFGWTRAELTQVEVQVNPTKTFYVNYPKPSTECASAPKSTILVVMSETGTKAPVTTATNAPAATAVKAEVTYTG